ncbi:hypothetical protein [Lentzea sp. E54]|uniref:hypothetical protein n=1 Tax=Lentzea xerophila TaxID=3435883 RepID=UPI003DA40CEC
MTTRAVRCPLHTSDYTTSPHPAVFDELADSGPVHRISLPGEVPAWLITERDLAERTLRDPRLVKDPMRVARYGQPVGSRRVPDDFASVGGRTIMNLDGDDHVRIRRVIGRRLSGAALTTARPMVEALVHRRLDTIARCDTVELVEDFAVPLVTDVIGQLFGVREDFTRAIITHGSKLFGPQHPADPDMLEAYPLLVQALNGALDEGLSKEGRDDLLGDLLAAQRDGRLRKRETMSNLALLMIAAADPVIALISRGVALVRADSHARAELLHGDADAVVESLLREQPPIPFTGWRFATEPMDLAGHSVAPGDAILVLIPAANRTVDAGYRQGHLSFGGGVHRCPGGHLARIETVAALRGLFSRFPDLRLELPFEEWVWVGGIGPRVPQRVPVLLNGAAR